MEEGYPELLDTFLNDSEARLRVLHEARDAEKLSATAHSFKGSSSNMGALRLAELCGELEQRAKQPSLGGIENSSAKSTANLPECVFSAERSAKASIAEISAVHTLARPLHCTVSTASMIPVQRRPFYARYA